MSEGRDPLSLTFAALADPTRRALLARLSAGEASVTELARPFLNDMSLPAVTKHLKVLANAGLVTKSRDAQWRPCRLNGAPLLEATSWIAQYRAFWEESLDRLGDYLKTVEPGPEEAPAKKKSALGKPAKRTPSPHRGAPRGKKK
jgi:DNA-binding transcriptional ArsR family regulator